MAATKHPTRAFFIFVLALGAFLGFFFAVDYPEILRTYYIPAYMKVRTAIIVPRYCCSLDCSCADVDQNVEQCGVMEDQAQALSPPQCAADNSSHCPPTGDAAICDNGYFCCQTCCSSCTTCTSSSGSTYSGSRRTCTTTSCDCYCCEEAEHQWCRMVCDVCYSVDLTVDFVDRQGVPRTASVSPDFGRSLDDANRFYDAHLPNSTFVAYYKPSDPTIIILSRDFTPRKWGLLVLFAVPLFVVSVVLTRFFISVALRRCRAAEHLDWKLNAALWLGIIWPLIILLPIMEVGYIEPCGKTALSVFIPVITAIGWLPLILHRLRYVGWSIPASNIVATCLGFVPTATLLPTMSLIPEATIPLAVVMVALLLALAASLIVSGQKLLDSVMSWYRIADESALAAKDVELSSKKEERCSKVDKV